MKSRVLFLTCIVVLATLFASIGVGAETPEGIPVERLNNLTNGITLAEMETTLGTNWQHQFTARIEKTDYLCVSYHFQYPFIYYYFLFRDDRLAKICIPPPFEVEIVERNGLRVEVRKPVNPERRVAAVMDAQGMSSGELIADIGKKIRNKKDGENLGILPAIIITSPLLIPRMMFDKPEVRREYQRNQELANRFNPLKLKPGALLAEARLAYGKELSLRRLNASKTVICWGGEEQLLKVKSEHRYSKVCALVEGERIQEIYSHDFVQGMNSDTDLHAPE